MGLSCDILSISCLAHLLANRVSAYIELIIYSVWQSMLWIRYNFVLGSSDCACKSPTLCRVYATLKKARRVNMTPQHQSVAKGNISHMKFCTVYDGHSRVLTFNVLICTMASRTWSTWRSLDSEGSSLATMSMRVMEHSTQALHLSGVLQESMRAWAATHSLWCGWVAGDRGSESATKNKAGRSCQRCHDPAFTWQCTLRP